MKIKKLLALILAVIMVVTVITACSSESKPTPADPKPEKANAPDTDKPDDSEDEPEDEEEPVDIEFYMPIEATNTNTDFSFVENALNAITEPELNIHVNIHGFTIPDMATQLSLAYAAKETVDVVSITPRSRLANLLADGMLLPMDPYMDLMKEAFDVVGPYANAFNYNGVQYGLPNYRLYGSMNWLFMNKEMLEGVGMVEAAENLQTWSDLEAIWDAVTAKYDTDAVGGMLTVLPANLYWNSDNIYDVTKISNGGDSYGILGVDSDLNVFSVYEHPGIIDAMKLMARWNQAGYINEDTWLPAVSDGDMHMINRAIFCNFAGSEFGAETIKEGRLNFELVSLVISKSDIETANVNTWGVGIGSTAAEPEAAARFINYVWTHEDVATLLCWGVEGESYVISNGEADYPEGKDASNCGLHNGIHVFGNAFLITPWKGNGADFNERALEYQLSCKPSPTFGFLFDTTSSDLSIIVSNIATIRDEYLYGLRSGCYTDELYQEFLDKLYAAGFEDYMGALQTQLKDWKA